MSDPVTPPAARGMDFAGRTVLVTGGARGIGAATVRAFVDHGADVIINHRRPVGKGAGAAKDLAAYAAERGRRASVLVADIGQPREVQRMFEAIAQLGIGRIDHLVLNAAATPFKPIIDMGPKDWQSLWNVNIIGNVDCVREALPLMPGGRIVAISSLGSRVELPNYPLGLAKAALESLVRSLDRELHGRGISAVGVCAGFTNTDTLPHLREMWAKRLSAYEALERRIVLEPEEIAGIVLFLCSPYSSAISGTTVVADAGASFF